MEWIPVERRERGRPRKTWVEGVRAAMKTRHLEADQWLNREEWCLGSGRRRQLSQDRKDRLYIHTLYVHAICVVLCRQTHCHVPTAASRLLLNANSQYIVTYEPGSRVRLGSGSNESNSSVCGMSRAGMHSCVCGELYPSLAPESSSPRRSREPGSYVYGQTLTCMDRLLRVWTDSYLYGQTLTCMDRLICVWTDSYVYGQTLTCMDSTLTSLPVSSRHVVTSSVTE